MNSNRMRNVGLLAAPLAALALLSGCGSDETGTAREFTGTRLNDDRLGADDPDRHRFTFDDPYRSHPNHNLDGTQSRRLRDRGTERHPRRVEWRRRFCGASGGLHQHGPSRTCTLDGFPGVSYVTGASGSEVGAAAGRSGSGSLVSLAPGSAATSLVRATNVENYPADQCGVTDVAGLRVYPPNSYDSVFLAYPTKGLLDDRREHQPADGRAGRPLNHGLRRRRPQSAGRRNRPERIRTSAASVN